MIPDKKMLLEAAGARNRLEHHRRCGRRSAEKPTGSRQR